MRMWGWLGMATVVAAACGEVPAQAGSQDAPAAAVASAAGAGAERQEVVYVDVRTAAEYAAGHVEGAIHIPHTELAERHGELEPYADRQIVLYCRSGRRSGIAKRILEEEGFSGLVNGGGLGDLRARGIATTR